MSLRDRRVAGVIDDVLIAGERPLFGETRSAAGNVGLRLIVAEAREQRPSRKGFIQTDVELGFVQLSDRLAHIVVAKRGVVRIRQRIQVDQFCPIGLISPCGILLQGVPLAWLPSGAAGRALPALSHMNGTETGFPFTTPEWPRDSPGLWCSAGRMVVGEVPGAAPREGTRPVYGIPCR
jgi:hypothetical protein